MAAFGDVLRGLGSALNPQVAQESAAEDRLRQQFGQQVGLMGLQQQVAQASPQYQAQVEALKNERGFREEVAGAGGDMTKIATAAMKWGKPEVAMNIYNRAEDRQSQLQRAREGLDARMQELQLRLEDRALDRDSKERMNGILAGLKAQSIALQGQIAQGNQELKALGFDLKKQQLASQPDPARNTPEFKQGLKDVTKDEQQVNNTNSLVTALNRWKELNSDVTTGRLTGYRPGIGQPQFQELQQLENFLAVNNFKPGQGQISNFERTLIKGAGPSTKNDPEVNDRIVNIQLGAIQNMKDRADFREWYLEKNKKLLGSDKAWSDYIEKEPRYKKGKDGEPIPNASRQDWQTFFKAKAPSGGLLDAADAIVNGK